MTCIIYVIVFPSYYAKFHQTCLVSSYDWRQCQTHRDIFVILTVSVCTSHVRGAFLTRTTILYLHEGLKRACCCVYQITTSIYILVTHSRTLISNFKNVWGLFKFFLFTHEKKTLVEMAVVKCRIKLFWQNFKEIIKLHKLRSFVYFSKSFSVINSKFRTLHSTINKQKKVLYEEARET